MNKQDTMQNRISAPGILRYVRVIVLVCLFINYAKVKAQAPNTLGFIPASIEEIDIAFPVSKKLNLSGQMDFQLVTQGAYTNSNPFAYAQRTVMRPWIIYSGIKNAKLWLGYAHNKKYEIKEAGNPEVLEHRLIVMGSFSKPLTKGSFFQQFRFETKFFEQNGIDRTIPRLRGRIGMNHFLPQHKAKPWFTSPVLSYYVELMLKFAPEDYSPNHFDIFRESIFYSAGITKTCLSRRVLSASYSNDQKATSTIYTTGLFFH